MVGVDEMHGSVCVEIASREVRVFEVVADEHAVGAICAHELCCQSLARLLGSYEHPLGVVIVVEVVAVAYFGASGAVDVVVRNLCDSAGGVFCETSGAVPFVRA